MEYHGIMLPEGMTHLCLDELAALLNLHCAIDNEETNEDAAVRVFEIVSRHRVLK